MSAHTPGPWRVVEEYDGSRTVAIMRDYRRNVLGLHVTADRDWVGDAPVDQIFANANLVAASPDLLSACRSALIEAKIEAARGSALWSDALVTELGAAIAKAEGR